MEQPCPRCGYVSDRPSRFCRQCGTPLFTESNASQATTRNYAPNQAAPTPHYTPYQDLQSGDELAPETTRFYRPPQVPEHQTLAPQPPPPARSSHTGKILLIALLCLLVIGGGITLLIVSQLRGIVDDQRRPTADAPAPPLPPPVGPPPPDAPPSSLEQYQYPGAKVTNSVGILGNDVLTLITADSVDKVTEHYRKRFGNPLAESRDTDGPSVVFHISGSPSAILTIHPDKDEPGKTSINIVRSNLLPGKMNRE